MSKNLVYRDNVILSLHPHNDRGSGISDAELGLLAGADRIEGTLFGNGERTGNVDIITLAMNLCSHGVDPKLDFHNVTEIAETYERLTRMQVSPRQPYAGELVFTAFSGSHQDAIAKGMKWREDRGDGVWSVPYLPIDPNDVGRQYDTDVIRINSQSGKGGVSYILKQSFGIQLPEKMKEEMGYTAKAVSDENHKELTPEWVHDIFMREYVNKTNGFRLADYHFKRDGGMLFAEITIHDQTGEHVIHGQGNGRLAAVANAFKAYTGKDFEIHSYEEHSLGKDSAAKAISYVGVSYGGSLHWGAGIDEDIIKASINALVVAIYRMGGAA